MFGRKHTPRKSIDPSLEPVLLVSICTGETTAGFRDRRNGKTTGVQLISSPEDLEAFRREYGITGDIPKVY